MRRSQRRPLQRNKNGRELQRRINTQRKVVIPTDCILAEAPVGKASHFVIHRAHPGRSEWPDDDEVTKPCARDQLSISKTLAIWIPEGSRCMRTLSMRYHEIRY